MYMALMEQLAGCFTRTFQGIYRGVYVYTCMYTNTHAVMRALHFEGDTVFLDRNFIPDTVYSHSWMVLIKSKPTFT